MVENGWQTKREDQTTDNAGGNANKQRRASASRHNNESKASRLLGCHNIRDKDKETDRQTVRVGKAFL